VGQFGSLTLFVLWLGFIGWLVVRVKRRRTRVGSAAIGTVYDMLNEEKRNAVELIVEERAGERDPERATDTDPDADPQG